MIYQSKEEMWDKKNERKIRYVRYQRVWDMSGNGVLLLCVQGYTMDIMDICIESEE